jgi:hypothetical protein
LTDSEKLKLNDFLEDEEDMNLESKNSISKANKKEDFYQYQDSSLSDSDQMISTDPTSSDVPEPGKLKATDSLLLLNQIGNENAIIGKLN